MDGYHLKGSCLGMEGKFIRYKIITIYVIGDCVYV